MSINAFPIPTDLAHKMVGVMSASAPENTYDILACLGTDGLCYIRETYESGFVTMHGKEIGRARHKRNAKEAKRISRNRMEQDARKEAHANKA